MKRTLCSIHLSREYYNFRGNREHNEANATQLLHNAYVGVLICLWLSYLQHNQKNFSWMG
jgi:hypothetical protein